MADDKLVKLTAPNGSTVRVSKERSESLLRAGYISAEPKTTTRKSSSSKSDE